VRRRGREAANYRTRAGRKKNVSWGSHGGHPLTSTGEGLTFLVKRLAVRRFSRGESPSLNRVHWGEKKVQRNLKRFLRGNWGRKTEKKRC